MILCVLLPLTQPECIFGIGGGHPSTLPPDKPACSQFDDCVDHDCMSFNTETNEKNAYLQLDPNSFNANPTEAVGIYDAGSLNNGLNLKDRGTGYYHWRNTDPLDTDDWGTMECLFSLEVTGKIFNEIYWNHTYCVLDMSHQQGGYFYPHHNHQNGCDADVRYLYTDFRETSLNLNFATDTVYSSRYTATLIDAFFMACSDELCASGVSKIILSDKARIEAAEGYEAFFSIDSTGEHDDHMHFQIVKP